MKYRVTGTMSTPFSVEVEAESEAAAIERMREMYETDDVKFYRDFTETSEFVRVRVKPVKP